MRADGPQMLVGRLFPRVDGPFSRVGGPCLGVDVPGLLNIRLNIRVGGSAPPTAIVTGSSVCIRRRHRRRTCSDGEASHSRREPPIIAGVAGSVGPAVREAGTYAHQSGPTGPVSPR